MGGAGPKKAPAAAASKRTVPPKLRKPPKPPKLPEPPVDAGPAAVHDMSWEEVPSPVVRFQLQ